MMTIAHYMVGSFIGLLLLIFFSSKSRLKGDMLFVSSMGVFAMIPDLSSLWGDYWMDEHLLTNVFVGHQLFDLLPDTPWVAFWFILLFIMSLFVYVRVVRGWRIEDYISL